MRLVRGGGGGWAGGVAGGKKSEAGFVPRRAPDRSGLRSRFHCSGAAGRAEGAWLVGRL